MSWIEMADRPAPRVKASLREPHSWYEFRNAASDEAELLLFDEIGGWFGIYADEFVEALKAVTAPKLTVRLNSPGGSVFEGIAVANALRAHPAEVTVRVEGLAASIASVIALSGDRLVMMPNAMMMIHDAAGGCWGQSADMQQMAEILDKVSDNIADAYAAKAGGTRADWRALMVAETWYLADEAVAAGLADEVGEPARPAGQDEPNVPAEEAMAAKWDLSVFQFAGRDQAPAPGAPQPPVAAQSPSSPQAEPGPAPAPPEPEPVAVEPAREPEPLPDPWAAAIAHLNTPPSTEDVWESLKEALLR